MRWITCIHKNRPIVLGRLLDGLVVIALHLQAEGQGLEFRSNRNHFQTISTPVSYSKCPGLSIKWTVRRLVTGRGTRCAWVIHESKAVHSNACTEHIRRCSRSLEVLKSVQQLFWRRHEKNRNSVFLSSAMT